MNVACNWPSRVRCLTRRRSGRCTAAALTRRRRPLGPSRTIPLLSRTTISVVNIGILKPAVHLLWAAGGCHPCECSRVFRRAMCEPRNSVAQGSCPCDIAATGHHGQQIVVRANSMLIHRIWDMHAFRRRNRWPAGAATFTSWQPPSSWRR